MTRRRVVTAAVAAAFVLGVAAVAVGVSRGGDGGRGAGTSALPKLRYGTGGTTAGASAIDALAPAGRIVYDVPGTLPALDRTAPAYRLVPDTTKERVAALAAALGVPADRVLVDPTQKPDTRSTPTLFIVHGAWNLLTLSPDCSVSSDGSTSCSASGVGVASPGVVTSPATAVPNQTTVASDCPMPPCPAGQACAQVCPQPASPPSASPPSAPVTTLPPPPSVSRPADLPSREDAERIGRDVLSRAGVDLASADVTVSDAFSLWQVTASPRIDGRPTLNLETSVSVGPKGAIVGGYGSLFKLAKVGDYPLAGTTKGLERLRKGAFSGPVPLMGVGAAEGSTAGSAPASSDGSASASPPSPDGKQPLPPDAQVTTFPDQHVLITGVHIALARSVSGTGEDSLAPVYVFETGATTPGIARPTLPQVPAVVDELLDTTAPAPAPEPAVGKTEPAPAVVPASPSTGTATQQP